MALDVCLNIQRHFFICNQSTCIFAGGAIRMSIQPYIFFTILYLAEAGIRLIKTGGLAIVTTYQTFYDVASHFLATSG